MVNNFNMGAWSTSDLSKIIRVSGYVYSSGSMSGFFPAGVDRTSGSNAYQVTAGKNFWVTKVFAGFIAANSNIGISLGYADAGMAVSTLSVPNNYSLPTGATNVVGNVKVSPANAIDMGFGTSLSTYGSRIADGTFEGLFGPFAPSKYPFFTYYGTGGLQLGVHLFGYEEDV